MRGLLFRRETASHARRAATTGGYGAVESPPDATAIPAPEEEECYALDPKRWVVLGYLASLALVSDWICYSIAPIMHLVEAEYEGFSPAAMVAVFLGTNVAGTLAEPWIVGVKGLRFSVIMGASLMLGGSILRTLAVSLLPGTPGGLAMLLMGSILVGSSQPFFNATPSMLAMNWFGESERTFAVSVAVNANQVGMALSFIVGGAFLDSVGDLAPYFLALTLLCSFLLVGTTAQFSSEPKVPPSAAAAEVRYGKRGPSQRYFREALLILSKEGFPNTICACVSGSLVSSTFATFTAGFFSPFLDSLAIIGLYGGLFQFSFVFGSLLFGKFVDRTRSYYSSGLFCFSSLCFFMVFFMGALDVGAISWCVILMLLIGVFSGPLEPIACETGVEVAFPHNENLVLAIQQFCSNLVGAIAIPVMSVLRTDSICYTKSLFFLLAVLVACMIHYSTFSGAYRRFEKGLAYTKSRSSTESYECTSCETASAGGQFDEEIVDESRAPAR